MFALFNVVWATLFLERWKQREAELAYRWGTLDTPAESLEEPRPQFRGTNSPRLTRRHPSPPPVKPATSPSTPPLKYSCETCENKPPTQPNITELICVRKSHSTTTET
ncbi:hypothetical protein DPEC_G00362320 [Dallia pectoralis]|nr:hypothetical protein DPEC_G00362320 [Dallia pectoralis]